jgi:hypothetical protein
MAVNSNFVIFFGKIENNEVVSSEMVENPRTLRCFLLKNLTLCAQPACYSGKFKFRCFRVWLGKFVCEFVLDILMSYQALSIETYGE